MGSYCYSLPGVSRIGWVPVSAVPPAVGLMFIATVDVTVFNEIRWITLADGAECTRKTTFEKSCPVDEATLTFRSAEEIPTADVAFIVVDAGGDMYLIGSREHPRPVIEAEKSLGKPGSDPAVTEYTVTHKTLRTMIQIAR